MKPAVRPLLLLITTSALAAGNGEDLRRDKAGSDYEENVRIAARYPVADLKKAIDVGDANTLKRLLDQGVPSSCPLPWSKDQWEGYPPPTDYPIHLAAASGHLEIVRLLLDRGANPKSHGCEGDFTPLHAANDVEIAKLLISRGADVNARDNQGWQPIHNATMPGYLENRRKESVAKSLALIKLLIEHGADPIAEDITKFQPVHAAAEYGTAETVQFFLTQGARVDAAVRDKDDYFRNGWQPLHFAASREDMDEALEVAEILIRKGAGVNAVTAEGESPLHLSKHAAMTKLLLLHDAKPDVMSTGTIKRQPIHHFAMRGDAESIKSLLDRGVDIEARSADVDGQTTALDTAAFWGKTGTVKFLLARGAKPTQRTMKNARRFDDNSIGIVRMLHQHGVTVSADMFLDHPQTCDSLLPFLSQETKDELLKHSARHIAEAASSPYHREAEGSLGTIRALVALGAKTDQPWQGLLPIHHAVFSGKEMVVGYFLSTGQPIDAKGTLRDNDSEPPIVITGIQPIHIALGSPEIIPYLINKGAKIDARTGEGWQPIHLAAAYGEKATLEAVIHAGGDPSAKTRDGKTPLQVAEKFGKKENADFLKDPDDGDSRPKSPPHRR